MLTIRVILLRKNMEFDYIRPSPLSILRLSSIGRMQLLTFTVTLRIREKGMLTTLRRSLAEIDFLHTISGPGNSEYETISRHFRTREVWMLTNSGHFMVED